MDEHPQRWEGRGHLTCSNQGTVKGEAAQERRVTKLPF